MTTLKTLDEALALMRSVGYITPLPELGAVADQLRAFRDNTELSNPEGFDTNILTNESGVVLVNVCALNGRLPTRF